MWDWIPGVRVGAFVFARSLPGNVGVDLEHLPPQEDGTDWVCYEVGEHLARIAVEDRLVVSVECFRSLLLRGQELLTRPIGEVNALLSPKALLAERYENGDERWECDALGITLWVEGGCVTSASVSSIDE